MTITKKSIVSVQEVQGKQPDPPEEPAGDDDKHSVDYEKEDPERYHSYMEAYTNQQLRDKFKEISGKEVPIRTTKRVLTYAIMAEEDAIKALNQ